VGTGDFNSDGRPDIVVTDGGAYPFYAGTVTMLVNSPSGTLSVSQTVPAGRGTGAIVVGDGDGRADVLVANNMDQTLSLFHGVGDGTVTAAGTFTLSGLPVGLAGVDANEDGALDVVVAEPGGVEILLGDGHGSFGPSHVIAVGNGDLRGVAVGDLDHDGHQDMAVIDNADPPTVTPMYGDGGGSFLGATPLGLGGEPIDVQIADMDGDGWADVVVANASSWTIMVAANNGGRQFLRPNMFGVEGTPYSLGFADFDQDGRKDIAVTIDKGISVLFSTPATFPTPTALSLEIFQSKWEGDHCIVRWRLSGSVTPCVLERSSSATGPWQTLQANILTAGECRDLAARPDGRSVYRIVYSFAGHEVVVGMAFLEPRLTGGELTVWPSPARDELHLDWPGVSGAVDLELLDLCGHRVRTWRAEASASHVGVLDVRGLHCPPGVYFIRARSGARASRTRLTVMR